ncbi:MAG: 30S ribosomal protein S20 [Caldilineaceae bacterium]|nr:30S ribosomal protein S20 [Caldilineaceae bacterium]MDE0179906.1 30S ribosomal protein S20 [Caldilineaceae bacterium]MDE0428587.1 30S ribosomal protein S20 [Caldilineaceae bacterium]
MPNIRSAAKRARQDEHRRERNRRYRSAARTAVKRARTLIEESDPGAREAVRTAAVALDRAAQRGAIHANNAARRKSRLMLQYSKAVAA